MLTRPDEGTPGSLSRSRRADLDLRSVFAGLEVAKAIVLAVSGGPDSLALLLLASQWASQLGSSAPRLHVASVDHGLRPKAAAEAAFVARVAQTLEVPHATLPWSGPKPASRLQERARDARYDLLRHYAESVGATHLLTAHHADDQAETVLFRLIRGSGLAGLGGMRRETELTPGIHLVRPLLGVTKADLIAVCRNEGQTYIDDPSNGNLAYARARLRAESVALAKLGLDRAALLRLSHRMARAEAALEAGADRRERMLAPDRGMQNYRANFAQIRDVEPEILLRLLQRAIVPLAGGEHRIRFDRLEALAEAVQVALSEARPHRATLAGTRIVLDSHGLLTIQPEGPRRRGLTQRH